MTSKPDSEYTQAEKEAGIKEVKQLFQEQDRVLEKLKKALRKINRE